MNRAKIVFAGVAVIAAIGATEAGANAAETTARLLPNQSITYTHGSEGYNCTNSFFKRVTVVGDVGPERWADHATLIAWRSPNGGMVTFDGITFRNTTSRAVRVAGVCP